MLIPSLSHEKSIMALACSMPKRVAIEYMSLRLYRLQIHVKIV